MTNPLIDGNLWRGALEVCQVLRDAGHRTLLAGGCVRDLLLGATPKDCDIATSARPEETAKLFHSVIGVGAAFGMQIVTRPAANYEVATFRHDGPYTDGRHPSHVEFLGEEEDARRRDFTINALFYDPETKAIIDYVGGQQDLRDGIVRAVGEPCARFEEDHLRLLRAVRFAARLDFSIETETRDAITKGARSIRQTSPERVCDELTKMLLEGGAKRAFELMDETELLAEVLPEIARMKGVDQPPEYHPEGDVFVHTLLLLDSLRAPSPTLAVGALLHDVGKPVTQTVEGRIRFNLHDKAGVRISEEICGRLRMSNYDTERISWLVGRHMRVAAAPEMRASKLKRLVREEGFTELLELFRLDCIASHNKLGTYEWLKDYAENLQPEETRPARLLTGRDLIAMGYRPGPLFKEILRAVEDAQLEGEIGSSEEARGMVHRRWAL